MKMIKNEELDEIEADIKKYSKITDVSLSEGGEELIKGYGEDIVDTISELVGRYKTSSHIELIALIAKLSEKIAIYRVLSRAEQNKKDAKKAYEKRLKELLS